MFSRFFREFQFNRRFFVITGFVLVLIGIGVVQVLELTTAYKPLPNLHNLHADIQIGLRIDEIDRNELTSVQLDFWEKNYAYNSNLPLVTVSLDYIFVSRRFILDNNIKSVCFKEIIIINKDVKAPQQNLTKNQKCADFDMNYVPSQDFAILVYNPYKSGFIDPYYFPFDKRSINFDLFTKLSFINSANNEVTVKSQPEIRAVARSYNLGETIWILHNNDENALSTTTVQMKRLFAYRVLVLFVILLVFVIMWHLHKVQKRASFWEVTAGIFLGLWGVHEVLVPENIKSVTFVSSIFLVLYLALAVFIFYETFTKDWDNDLQI